jgi:hypothetical protein
MGSLSLGNGGKRWLPELGFGGLPSKRSGLGRVCLGWEPQKNGPCTMVNSGFTPNRQWAGRGLISPRESACGKRAAGGCSLGAACAAYTIFRSFWGWFVRGLKVPPQRRRPVTGGPGETPASLRPPWTRRRVWTAVRGLGFGLSRPIRKNPPRRTARVGNPSSVVVLAYSGA